MDKNVMLLMCLFISCCIVLECEAKGGRAGGRVHVSGSYHGTSHRSYSTSGSRYGSSSKSSSHSYPASRGLSGNGRAPSHTYPASGAGYSGNSGSSRGSLSGSGRPRSTLGSQAVYRYYGYLSSSNGVVHIHPQQPQFVYVQHYRHTDSKYSDLLTGLTLYNMARSHHHHYDNHYYYDSYYRDRYVSHSHIQNTESDLNSGTPSYKYNEPKEQASCSLRIKEKKSGTKVLNIPCEIVSTFTEGSNVYGLDFGYHQCTYDDDDVIMPGIATEPTKITASTEYTSTTTGKMEVVVEKGIIDEPNYKIGYDATNSPFVPSTNDEHLSKTDHADKYTESLLMGEILSSDAESNDNSDIDSSDKIHKFASRLKRGYFDVKCIKNPTSVIKDGPLNLKKICIVEIRTSENVLLNEISCEEIMEFAHAPLLPEHDKKLLPPAEKIRSWMENPPWWMTLFVAV